MKKSIAIVVVIFVFHMHARDMYIYNATNETVSIKEPTKANNKILIPYELKAGEVLIKNLDAEGTVNDTLDLVYGGVTSGNVKKLSKKYNKSVSVLKISWDSPQLAEIQSKTGLAEERAF